MRDASVSDACLALWSALKRGSGRAMMVLTADPDDPDLRATLLRACSTSLAYDPQCEGSRADYLHRLVVAAGQSRPVFAGLMESLSDPDEVDVDVVQTFELACLLAADDPGRSRERLRGVVTRSTFDAVAYSCMDALVRLDGVDAVMLCVRRFEADLRNDDGGVFASMVEALTARDGAESARTALDEARPSCPDLDGLLAMDEARRLSGPRSRSPVDPGTVLAGLAAGQPAPLTWVKVATSDDLDRVVEGLLSARDDAAIARYLRIFSRRDYPDDPSILMDLATAASPHVAHLAVQALRRIDRPNIRSLALEWLAEGRHWDRAISLLRGTYRTGDLSGLAERFRVSVVDEEARHRLGCAILDVLDHAPVPEAESRDLLFWLYENGPCSICRARAIGRLAASRSMPRWILDECRFDADPETARLASERFALTA